MKLIDKIRKEIEDALHELNVEEGIIVSLDGDIKIESN